MKTTSLVAAEALFLWMFLAADSLEQLGASEAFGGTATGGAFAFAASWRHGMAGNSPLYMPGFFAVAVAAWMWSDDTDGAGVRGYVAALGAASAVAWLAAPVGGSLVVSAFASSIGAAPGVPAPRADLPAMFFGLYTLLTWTAFVIGCRVALRASTWMPLIPTVPLTMGLALLRPWTVDDFTATWWLRLAGGDVIAAISFLMIPTIGSMLYWVEIRARAERRISRF